MKRKILCFMLVFLCLGLPGVCSGENLLRGYEAGQGYQYVSFGRFPQGKNAEVLPIVWRVLSVADGQALLLSEYVLFNNRIHPDDAQYLSFGCAFNRSELFALLNGPFDAAPVSDEERGRLLSAQRLGRALTASLCFVDEAFTQRERETLVCDEELGTAFLLSVSDLRNKDFGFDSDKSRQARGTEYALAGGLFKYQNGSSPYWLRDPSEKHAGRVRCTKAGGDIGYIRCVVMNEGCRPAVRLRTEGLRLAGGDGSLVRPLTFDLKGEEK